MFAKVAYIFHFHFLLEVGMFADVTVYVCAMLVSLLFMI